MCLITKKIKHSYKLKNGLGLIPVWKVITIDNESPMAAFDVLSTRCSDQMKHTWKKGWHVAKFNNAPVTKNVADGERVDCGFHFCLTRKDAKSYKYEIEMWQKTSYLCSKHIKLKVVKMYVKKEDIIAKGISVFGSNVEHDSLVAKRAFVKEI